MGTLQLGKDVRLTVEDPGAPNTYIPVGGEGRLSFQASPDTIDGASKDDGNYKVEYYGQQKISITLSGKTKLPDDGLAALDEASKTNAGINVKIVKGATVLFHGDMTVGNRQADWDNAQAATYSFSLGLAAAPTVDSLFG